MIHRFPDSESRDAALAQAVAAQLRRALRERGSACLAVSGGSTPKALFELLSTTELDWKQVVVTLVDERWVPADHVDSNERLVRATLLKNAAAAATFVSLKSTHSDPAAALHTLEQQLRSLPLPFAAVLLGMGEDGHTASWFSDAPELAAAINSQQLCAAITPTRAPHRRITLTPWALTQSEWMALQIGGEAKWRVLQQALQDGPAEQLPIRYMLRRSQPPLQIYWGP